MRRRLRRSKWPLLNPLVRSTAVPTPPRPVGPSARPAGRSRHSLRRLSAVAFAVGLLVITGCADVPTNYNERAEENFLVGCKDGGSAEYCRCVWTKLEKTVKWGEFSKFDKDQQTADEEGRQIKVPSGIQAAFDSCLDNKADGTTTTAKGDKTTTTLG